MDLAGRRVWIIGASTGIGAALASELVDRGAAVAISARRVDQLKEVAGDRMAIAELDITDVDQVPRALAEVVDELGGVDIVVLSAGYWKQMGDDFDVESFHRHLDVNLGGFANCLGAVIPYLRKQRAG